MKPVITFWGCHGFVVLPTSILGKENNGDMSCLVNEKMKMKKPNEQSKDLDGVFERVYGRGAIDGSLSYQRIRQRM
jgi:hypothetical protein